MWERLSSRDHHFAIQLIAAGKALPRQQLVDFYPAPSAESICRSTSKHVPRNPLKPLHLFRKIIFQGAFAINIGGGTVQSASKGGYLE